MSRMVNCVVLKKEAEGMERAPHPGELGQRIYDNVSKEGWTLWLQRLAMIINEGRLNTADPRAIPEIEKHMEGFFFNQGSGLGGVPSGFHQ